MPSLAVIIGALLLVRRWARRQAGPTSGMRIVSRTGITRGAVVAVVEIGARRFLVGAGEQGVSLLTELDPHDVELSLVPTHGSAAPSPVAMESATPRTPGPRMGLVDRLRAMTVRTHLEGPTRATRP